MSHSAASRSTASSGPSAHTAPEPSSAHVSSAQSSSSHCSLTTQDSWTQLRSHLHHYLERSVIQRFIDSSEIIFEQDHVVFLVANANEYQGFITHALSGIKQAKYALKLQDLYFRVLVHPRDAPRNAPSPAHTTLQQLAPPKSTLHKRQEPRGLDQRYTFENFVKGPSNQFAHAMCRNVAENPGMNYNPLFIYGHSGLGKTHLLHAVGGEIAKRRPDLEIILTTTDHFMNEMIHCIRHSKQPHFKQKYGGCGVLLMDDIQFISGKKATQEEFFHVFNTLYEAKKQIVITSDKYPQEIADIEERLRNRFEWGLISDIQPPDKEHRMAILHTKAAQFGITLDNDVAEYIAHHCHRNVRELEGVLRRVMAFATFQAQPISVPLAASALQHRTASSTTHSGTLIHCIQKVVAKHYKIKVSDLCSAKRHRSFSRPRQIAFYLARSIAGVSYPQIGSAFGGKDHSTVMHGVQKITKDMTSDRQLRETIQSLKQQIPSPPSG